MKPFKALRIAFVLLVYYRNEQTKGGEICKDMDTLDWRESC